METVEDRIEKLEEEFKEIVEDYGEAKLLKTIPGIGDFSALLILAEIEMYGNESGVGKAIQGYDRDDLFITSKVMQSNLHYEDVLKSCKNERCYEYNFDADSIM